MGKGGRVLNDKGHVAKKDYRWGWGVRPRGRMTRKESTDSANLLMVKRSETKLGEGAQKGRQPMTRDHWKGDSPTNLGHGKKGGHQKIKIKFRQGGNKKQGDPVMGGVEKLGTTSAREKDMKLARPKKEAAPGWALQWLKGIRRGLEGQELQRGGKRLMSNYETPTLS